MVAQSVEDDEEVMGFFEKFSYDTFPSKYLKYLEIPAWDCREALEEEPVLHLSDRDVTDDDAVALGRAMRLLQPPQLRRLYLTRNHLGDKGCAALAAGAAACPNLEVLYLQANRIGDGGAAAIATSMQAAPLWQLVLSDNALTDEGVRALAAAARGGGFRAMKALYLDGHRGVTDAGVCALAEALPSFPAIETLALQKCGFGDKGARALAEAIGKGGVFTAGRDNWIYVFDNEIGEEAKSALREACKGICKVHTGWPAPVEGVDFEPK
ncbi:hypothetical protein AB1Y20_011925 [Prymnesium parvum]|uniref:Distal membrane arm assembly complex 2-like protein n=1 Tax=Prymnesium parvum TaxID=97485 RepID=A0AB34IN16_PRYPA